jgi:CubicO group peptidase (beta-lactamase class C family)
MEEKHPRRLLLTSILLLAQASGGLLRAAQDPPADGPGPADALKPHVERREIAGAVTLVATKNRILSLQAVGFQDLAAEKKMRTDALFWIASESKPITATAVMMLVDEGKLSLDDPVEKFLPEFKGQMVVAERDDQQMLLKKPVHPMTLRNVLSHMSGLRFSSPMERPTLDRLSIEDAVRSHALLPLQWEPESKYQYSNAGINTAARILEVVSGERYEDFLQKRLFDPLGLKDTTFWPGESQVDRLAKGYKPNAAKDGLEETRIGQLTYPLTDRHRQPMPAGGLFSTAADVARFCQMILAGGEWGGRRYLSEKSVAEMTTRQTPASIKESYGLGWSTGETFGHGGAWATGLTIDPKRGLILVYMVQHTGDNGKCHGVFKRAALEMFGK